MKDSINKISADIALKESEARITSLFRSAPVVIGVVSNRILLEVNEYFCEMHGYTEQELIGKPILDVFAAEVRSEIPRQIRLAHKKGHHIFESKHIHKNGAVFPVSVDVTASER